MIFAFIIMYVLLRSLRPYGYYGYRYPRHYRRPLFFSPWMFAPRPPMGGRGPGMGRHHPRGPFGF
ncbi:MAG: hypothetical protein IKX74_05710 [Erysipelotrichaceae bacterium]|nr:hypothetical protein [Erysipelotrichaceae bacterium]MBO4537543.1 hypothetical protein [Erysipelotrichaceae bacterium]MBR5049115.1 hypothetical protein [Erysipelotrichaceae bacterium]